MGGIAKQEAGNRYGKLTVISRAGSLKKKAMWLCKCDCGNECVVKGARLRSGCTKSCGCLRKHPRGEAAQNSLYLRYRRQARRRYFAWGLLKEKFLWLTEQKCHYCGTEPKQVVAAGKRSNGKYVYNGIDRVDSTRGYMSDNIVTCCGVCNMMKRNLSYEDFVNKVEQIHEHRKKVISAT